MGYVQVAARTWGGFSIFHPLYSAAVAAAAAAPDGQFPASAASCSW